MRSIKHRIISAVSAVALLLSALPVVPTRAANLSTNVVEPFRSDVSFTLPDGTTTQSSSYRIPAMVTMANGTMVAAADVRWNTTYDGGGLDTLVARSSDGGVSWSYTLANYLGDNGNEYNGSDSTCFIDPCLVVNKDGDTVYMLVDLYPYGIALNGSDNSNTAPSTKVGFNGNDKLLLSDNDHESYDYYLNLTDYYIYFSDGEPTGIHVDAYFNYEYTPPATFGLVRPEEEAVDSDEESSAPEEEPADTDDTTGTDDDTTGTDDDTTGTDDDTTGTDDDTTGTGDDTTNTGDDTTDDTAIVSDDADDSADTAEDDSEASGDQSADTPVIREKSLLDTILDDLVPTASAAEVDEGIVPNAVQTHNLFFKDSPFQVVRTGYLYLTKSTDYGETWSAPKLLNLKTDREQVCLVGPGRGVTMSNGTMIIPIYSYNNSSQHMGFLYSSDGENWHREDSKLDIWSSESAVVELKNGGLRFFIRNGTKHLCYVDYSFSTGWGSLQQTQITTNSNTQISAITYSKTADDGSQVILVSCPAGGSGGSNSSQTSARNNGRIFVFNDNGIDMTLENTVDVNNSTFLYSCLTERKDGSVALLYEDSWSPCGMEMVAYSAADLGLVSDSSDDSDAGEDNDGNTVNITLEVGESQQATPNTAAVVSGTHTTADGVAQYEIETTQNRTHPDSTAKLGSNSSYTGTTKNLHDALYTFTGDNNNGFTVQNNGIYLGIDANRDPGYPGNTTSENLVFSLRNLNSGEFDIKIAGRDRYLYFHRSGDKRYRFDRQGTSATETAFLLYAPVDSANTSSTELPGYYRITAASQIKSGGKYLIVAYAGDAYYVLYPSTSTSNYYAHVAKATGTATTCTEQTAGTTVTFTGLKPGNTTVAIGDTTFNVQVTTKTVTKKINLTTDSTSSLNPLADLDMTDDGYTIVYELQSGEVITLTDNVVTPTGQNGTATVIAKVMKNGTVYGSVSYDVAVADYVITDVQHIHIPVGSDYTVTFANADGTQKIFTSNLDTSIANVVWSSDTVYMPANGTFTATGKKAGSTSVVVGSTEFILYVYPDTAHSAQHFHSVYINIQTIQNCTVYYAINGGELQEVTGTGVLIDQLVYGGYHVVFFAKPDDGYVLTFMAAPGSDSQFYSLSNGTKSDGTDSAAWPYDSNGNVKQDTLANGSTRDHGIYGCIQYGILTANGLKDLYTRALAIGCDGVQNFTRTANDNSSLSATLEFIAEKLPDIEKTIIGYTRGNPAGLSAAVKANDAANGTFTHNGVTYYNFDHDITLEFGDTLLYEFTITSYSTGAEYTDISLVDDKIGTTIPISDGTFNTAGTYTYHATYTLKQADLHMYTGGQFQNAAELQYKYKSRYATGVYGGNASDHVTCDIIGIVSYVWADGTPAEIVANKDGEYTLPESFSLTVMDFFTISKYGDNEQTEKTTYTDGTDTWTYSGEWGVRYFGSDTLTWFDVDTALNGVNEGRFQMENARSITFYGRWLKNYTVLYRWGGVDHPEIDPPDMVELMDGSSYTVDNDFKVGQVINQKGYTWTFQGWKEENTGAVCNGQERSINGSSVAYVGTWTKDANETSLTIEKKVDRSYGANEKFLFRVTDPDNNLNLIVTVPAGESATIQGLPVGTKYTVTELTDWSWRYTPDENDQVIVLKADGAENVVTFENDLTDSQWLTGDDFNENQYSSGSTPKW